MSATFTVRQAIAALSKVPDQDAPLEAWLDTFTEEEEDDGGYVLLTFTERVEGQPAGMIVAISWQDEDGNVFEETVL